MNSNNYNLNKLFTKQTLNDLVNHSSNDFFKAIIHQYLDDYDNFSYKEIFSNIYKYMSKHYRNEYFYQNTLLNKLLLGRHNINTTTALTQLPIEKSKADFILINGKAVVYEIKTELDNFDRLYSQINDYYKAFDYVCVVTSEDNFDKVSNLLVDSTVGICILSNKNTLQFKKEPEQFRDFINHRSLYKILRKKEIENIILKYNASLPSTKPVFYYEECFNVFKSIPIDLLYKDFLLELKNRKQTISNEAIREIPYELKSVYYFSSHSRNDSYKLNDFLNSKYEEEC
ncbi:sce7726 family protein [Fundicoccus culcitae]|uniref:Sce7726 family protein n=1 Tax=Fundicoccus culcitae TaxID=2969821 RepID=A0ABY5P9I7_9LACT|nr:sce7726 family protein [Fundicoccus culcitae]UUX35189.1 sce7726 family protein [Fundicoccus culcitae]